MYLSDTVWQENDNFVSLWMRIPGAAVSLHIQECHNDVFFICWFGLVLLELYCHWNTQSSCFCNWNTCKCSIVRWVVISLYACCTRLSQKREREKRVRVSVNKTSNQQQNAALLMERKSREVQSSFYCTCGLPEETCEQQKASTCSITFLLSRANCPGSEGNLCCN